MILAAAVTALLLLAGCFALGRWLGGRRRAIALAASATCLGFILLRAFFRYFPAVEYDLLPFDAYAVARPWWAFPFALALLGIGTRQMSRRRDRVAVGVLALALCGLVGGKLYQTSAPASEMTGVPGPDGICRQTTMYSCGAAAAATLLAQFGVASDEREMATLCWTNAFTGTDEFSVCRGLRRKLAGTGRRVGLVDADWASLTRRASPAMATMRYAFFVDHWVVVLDAQEHGVVLADPLRGRVDVSKTWFLDNWRGVVVVADP